MPKRLTDEHIAQLKELAATIEVLPVGVGGKRQYTEDVRAGLAALLDGQGLSASDMAPHLPMSRSAIFSQVLAHRDHTAPGLPWTDDQSLTLLSLVEGGSSFRAASKHVGHTERQCRQHHRDIMREYRDSERVKETPKPKPAQTIDPEFGLSVVRKHAQVLGQSVDACLSGARKMALVEVRRRVAIELSGEHGWSTTAISTLLGGRDHTSVLHLLKAPSPFEDSINYIIGVALMSNVMWFDSQLQSAAARLRHLRRQGVPV